jgi:hypothetical protein
VTPSGIRRQQRRHLYTVSSLKAKAKELEFSNARGAVPRRFRISAAAKNRTDKYPLRLPC